MHEDIPGLSCVGGREEKVSQLVLGHVVFWVFAWFAGTEWASSPEVGGWCGAGERLSSPEVRVHAVRKTAHTQDVHDARKVGPKKWVTVT